MAGDLLQQRPFDLHAGRVLEMEDPSFRVPALLAEIQFPHAIGSRDFAFGKFHPQVDQFRDAGGTFLHDRAHHRFVAKPCTCLQGVAHMHLHGVLLAGDGRDTALGVIGVGFRPVLFRDDRNPSVGGHFIGKSQAGDSAAEHQKIKLFHLRCKPLSTQTGKICRGKFLEGIMG